MVAPVVFLWLDEVFAEYFAGVLFGDDGFGFIDQDQDVFSSMVFADAEVVHDSGSSEAEFAVLIDLVFADSPVVGD